MLAAYLLRHGPKLSFGCDTAAEGLASIYHMQMAATIVRLAWQRALRRRQVVGRST